MNYYRSLETKLAVQYHGEPIEGVTCDGNTLVNHCDSRSHLPHVHSKATGGMTMLRPGVWIMPEPGGPFHVVEDGVFRQYFEVVADPKPQHFLEEGEVAEVKPSLYGIMEHDDHGE